jgi:hypothetical protein
VSGFGSPGLGLCAGTAIALAPEREIDGDEHLLLLVVDVRGRVDVADEVAVQIAVVLEAICWRISADGFRRPRSI